MLRPVGGSADPQTSRPVTPPPPSPSREPAPGGSQIDTEGGRSQSPAAPRARPARAGPRRRLKGSPLFRPEGRDGPSSKEGKRMQPREDRQKSSQVKSWEEISSYFQSVGSIHSRVGQGLGSCCGSGHEALDKEGDPCRVQHRQRPGILNWMENGLFVIPSRVYLPLLINCGPHAHFMC